MDDLEMRAGLGVLMRAAKEINQGLYAEENRGRFGGLHKQRIEKHPFGLPVPHRTGSFPRNSGIEFVGNQGITASLYLMAAYVAENLDVSLEQSGVTYLRVIYARTSDEEKSHEVFYEIMVNDRVFMAGGASDCSGEGGRGKKAMDSFFALLSHLFGVVIQKEEASVERFKKAKKLFFQLAAGGSNHSCSPLS